MKWRSDATRLLGYLELFMTLTAPAALSFSVNDVIIFVAPPTPKRLGVGTHEIPPPGCLPD